MKLKLIIAILFIKFSGLFGQEFLYYCSRATPTTATWQVYKKNLTTSVTYTITNDPNYNYWRAEPSPDNSKLLIVRSPANVSPDQENYVDCDIVKCNTDGTGMHVIIANNQYGWYGFGNPHFHPTGNRILLIAQPTSTAAWNLYTVDTAGNNPQQLTTTGGIDANWSPLGNKVVFVSLTGPSLLNLEIFKANYNYATNQVSNIVQLTNDTTRDHDPCFSPNGDKIAFCAGNASLTDADIVTIDTSGANRTGVVNDNGTHGGNVNWGTNNKIYYHSIYVSTFTNFMADDFNCGTNSVEAIFNSSSIHYLHPFYRNQITTSIKNLQEKKGTISCFPNPAFNIINIVLENQIKDIIQITDCLGRIVSMHEIDKTTSIDLETLQPGIYFLVSKTDQFIPQKFIKN
ncbi:MAG: T9SS type A sorting domain-containing protein [Bacteroidetes bacterium]|nr:T9SS type A sorting domain-containing protein [Bacteroidota bacterium]